MAIALAILQAIIALPKIGDLVNGWVGQISVWWVQNQRNETKGMIADALALGQKAETEEERYAVSEAWQRVLDRPRVR